MRRQIRPTLSALAVSLVVIAISVVMTWDTQSQAISKSLNYVSLLKAKTHRIQEKASESLYSAEVNKQKQSHEKQTHHAGFEQRYKELSEKAQKKGFVCVLVKLRAVSPSESNITDKKKLQQAQRAEVKEVKEQFLSGLRYNQSSMKNLGTTPYVALSVDSSGLEQIALSSDVIDISEDRVMRFVTSESFPLIGVTKSWTAGYKGTGKTIAILDTGVGKNHAALSGKVVSEACYSTNNENEGYTSTCPGTGEPSTADNSGLPCELEGGGCEHGTQVAGVAAGKSGVAKEANIISIKVATIANNERDCFGCVIALTSDVILGLQRVKELRSSYDIAAVNISLATENPNVFTSNCDGENSALTDEINDLRNYGIATIIPSGKGRSKDAISFPACISSAISVGATNDGSETDTTVDTIWKDSNISSFLNLLAPGNLINAPIPGMPGENKYLQTSGTSLASAHVAGAWALLRQKNSLETVWVDDQLPAGAVTYGEWNWVSSNPNPFSGSLAHQSNISSDGNQHYFENATQTMQVNPGDTLYTWVYLDPANVPEEVMLQWLSTTEGWNHRAYWGANRFDWGADGTTSRRYMGPLPASGGWVKLEVAASAVGLEGKSLNGMAFTLWGGRATWDKAGKYQSETVWVDDALPTGAIPLTKEGDSWNWVGAPPSPYSGSYSHVSNIATGMHEHYFEGATQTLPVNVGDSLFAYAYIDPANIPEEIMLEWNDGSWEHRAYWGANKLAWGTDGTGARRYMGPIPQVGNWVRLEVPASKVDLEGKTLNGMAFTLYGGRVWWDKAGKATNSVLGLLTKFRETGVPITDTRDGTTGATVPRIQIDSVLGVNIPASRWIGSYYNKPDPIGKPDWTQDDGDATVINRYYQKGISPATNIGTTNYSIRWTGTVTLNSEGTYRFSVTADDGVRLYIDDEEAPKLDSWGAKNTTSYNVDIPLIAGDHKVILEYSQSDGDGMARLTWGKYTSACSQQVDPSVWKGEYFNNHDLSGTAIMVLDDILNPQNINRSNAVNNSLRFDWGGGSPTSSCSVPLLADLFSVRWTRTVNFPSNKYIRFHINADDGVRLFVDDMANPKVDKWNETVGYKYFDIPVSAGNRTVKLEFREFGGSAYSHLWWEVFSEPVSPSNLSASPASPSQINLNWADNSNNEDGFKVERWNGSSWMQIAIVGANVTTYADSGLASATTYSYRVRAYNVAGDSGYSNESSVTTPIPIPANPGNFTARATSYSSISLTWSSSPYADGYIIERDGRQIDTVGANATQYGQQGLQPETRYSYRIRAYNSSGSSGYSSASAETLVKPPPCSGCGGT